MKCSAQLTLRLGCHGTRLRYVPHARGWFAYPVRTVPGASGQTGLRLRRLLRVARTYSTEAPGRTCQLRLAPPPSRWRRLLQSWQGNVHRGFSPRSRCLIEHEADTGSADLQIGGSQVRMAGQSQCASSCSATRVSNSAGRASRESDGLGWRAVGARADTSPTTSNPASSAAPPL